MSSNMNRTEGVALLYALLYSSPLAQLIVVNQIQHNIAIRDCQEQDILDIDDVTENQVEEVSIVGIELAEQDGSVVQGNVLLPYSYYVSVDTINIKAKLDANEINELERQLRGSFRYSNRDRNYCSVYYEDAYGVLLYFKPRKACWSKGFSLSLFRHGYSHESKLLQLVELIVPKHKLLIKRIDVSIDVRVTPQKICIAIPKSNISFFSKFNSNYMGAVSANDRLVQYDKQLQLKEKINKDIESCTRIEYRKVLEHMKPITDINWRDLDNSSKFNIIHSINEFEPKHKKVYESIIKDASYTREGLSEEQRKESYDYALPYSTNVYGIFQQQAQYSSLQDLIYTPYDITQLFKVS